MAGPKNKLGLDFWLIETTMDGDPKVARLLKAHPDKGFEIYVRLLNDIYRERGWFIEFTPKQLIYYSEKFSISTQNLLSVVTTCHSEGLFNKSLYSRYYILTSASIQERFLKWAWRRRKIWLVKDFCLLSPDLIYSINQRTHLLTYDDMNELFIDGVFNPEWRAIAKESVLVTKPQPTEANEAPVIGLSTYGSPLIINPANLNWAAEKQLLLNDVEWKYHMCNSLGIGQAVGREFSPEFKTLEKYLDQFFEWLESSGGQKTCRMMKGHFTNWYPRREEFLRQMPKDKRKSPLHLGSQDFDNQIPLGK